MAVEDYPDNTYVSPNAYLHPSTMEKIISRDTLIRQLRDSLEGIMRNEKGDIIYQGQPLVNQRGRDRLLAIYIQLLNSNVLLSNLTMHEIDVLTQMLGEAIDGEIYIHHKEWEIEDIAQMDTVSSTMMSNVFSILKAAEGGFMMDHLSPMIQHKEEEKHGGPVQQLLPFFGGEKR